VRSASKFSFDNSAIDSVHVQREEYFSLAFRALPILRLDVTILFRRVIFVMRKLNCHDGKNILAREDFFATFSPH
jgi:hypothetical protein